MTEEMTAAAFMPHVTLEMASAEYWISKVRDPDRVLEDEGQIKALNKEIVGVPGCHLRDMLQFAEHPASGEREAGTDPSSFQKHLLTEVRSSLSKLFGDGLFVASGDPFSENEAAEILQNVLVDDAYRESVHAGGKAPAWESGNADGGTSARESANAGGGTLAGPAALYGICTKITDIRMAPTDLIVTDSVGDLDFDLMQLDSLKINDPVIIRAESADGRYVYCDAAAMSGWVRKEDIAVCRDREEWLGAWNTPDAEVVVVTQGKILLDDSHVNQASSGRVLSMGCTLRRVRPEEYDASVTNRASFYNYAVYLPVRKETKYDAPQGVSKPGICSKSGCREGYGSCAWTTALIPMHSGVSAGFLPLTVRNILTLAFSRIGDAYGWGGMLSTPDCSAYVREIYRCFGLVLPRNTDCQREMPVRRWRMDSWSNEKKQELLDTLRPGALLFFKGHVMLYLGENSGRHYVVNALSSMLDPQTGSKVRVRSIVINTLEDSYRPSGICWLDDLNMAMVPYEADAANAAAGKQL